MEKRDKTTTPASVMATSSIDMSVIRGNTGRRTHVGEGFRLAQAWLAAPNHAALTRHPAARRFRNEVGQAHCSPHTGLTCFRGCYRDGKRKLESWEDMGPPNKIGTEGRYNSEAQIVLYLSSSEEGARREKPNGRLCLQEYQVPAGSWRIADFSLPGMSEFLGAVFDMAETSGPESEIGRNDYAFSQLVADLVRSAGFHGMLVPGVRGDSLCHYLNVVIFDPPAASNWRSWSSKERGFRLDVA